ncbi:hypothetical protein J7L67_00565 [bacterium]|nr:hypothetical protein [bacterium]
MIKTSAVGIAVIFIIFFFYQKICNAEEKCSNFFSGIDDFYNDYFDDSRFFAEGLYGIPVRDYEKTEKDEYIAFEGRIHFETTHYLDYIDFLAGFGPEIIYSGDLLVDIYEEALRYETRELSLFLRPNSLFDIKIGRQILTWGTGDYLFINDMFAKDYISFFIGRNDEYLKKPQDSLRVTFFNDIVNIDAVFLPWFFKNTTPTGDRILFFNGFKGKIAGEKSNWRYHEPKKQFSNSEQAVRMYRNIGRYEVAGYFFNGFLKNPRGFKNIPDTVYYPPVTVYGASVRGPFYNGIANTEIGYLDSRNDRNGNDPLIENSMIKYLLGYSQGFQNDLTMGVQYYIEQMMRYHSYKRNLMNKDFKRDPFRQLLTYSIRKEFFRQTGYINIFVFYSPTDNDVYCRPSVGYDINDSLTVMVGGNLFWGEKDFTEFGQYEKNTNIYIRVRYSL